MNLVVVESPAKAGTIKKYLGKDFKVLASYGHICDVPSKKGSVRPEEDFAIDYQISPSSTKHVKALSDAAKESDSIYLATDPDREGEAISWHVIETLKQKKAIKKSTQIFRISFNEITKNAVQHAVKNPRELDMDLIHAQQARRALDYLVGFTLSPVLWKKLPGSKSAGRVQSVALRLICDREDEIEKFNSQEYWHLDINFNSPKKKEFIAKLTHFNGNKIEQLDIKNEKQAKEIKDELDKKQYSISNIEKKQSSRNPQPPFTTSSLQQEASRKLGFGAKRTMMVAQKLYEGVNINGQTQGLITYMRTDGVSVSQEAINASRKFIDKEYGNNYLPKSQRVYKSKAKNAQEAHEAIRPTDIYLTPASAKSSLTDEQYKLYNLIWQRMVASQMASTILDQVAAEITSSDNIAQLRANGSTIRFDGFQRLYLEGKDDSLDENSKKLPELNKGDDLEKLKVNAEQHFTQPPPRYSEASLVKTLEKFGIGRPSTYANIISVLQERSYVAIDKKRFIPEERGRVVTGFLTEFFNKYVEYDFTANLEDELDLISDGKIEWKKVLRNFWDDFDKQIQLVTEKDIAEICDKLDELFAHRIFQKDKDGQPIRECSDCKTGKLSLKLGKFGPFIGCSNYPECKHIEKIAADEEQQAQEDISLGKHPENGSEILLKKGPYGLYVEMSIEGEKKPKRTSVPKGVDDVDFETALSLLSLPREIGTHPETNLPISVGIGRFGPYLLHDKKYHSIKDPSEMFSIGINRAVSIIAEKKKSTNDPLREIGKYEDKDVNIYDGRYGPYIKFAKKNISIPKNLDYKTLTLEEAIELIKKKK